MKLDNSATKGHTAVAADPFWRELRNLLTQLRQLQIICCPDSSSHEEESRTSPFNAELKKTYEALSGGITFKAFQSIESQQIGELAHAWSDGRDPAFDFAPTTRTSGTNAFTSSPAIILSFQRQNCGGFAPSSIRRSRVFSGTYGARKGGPSSIGTNLSGSVFKDISSGRQ